jgi:hypothetical protein
MEIVGESGLEITDGWTYALLEMGGIKIKATHQLWKTAHPYMPADKSQQVVAYAIMWKVRQMRSIKKSDEVGPDFWKDEHSERRGSFTRNGQTRPLLAEDEVQTRPLQKLHLHLQLGRRRLVRASGVVIQPTTPAVFE